MTNMDEQNRVEDIDGVDGGSTFEQNVEQSYQPPYQQTPQYGQPIYA